MKILLRKIIKSFKSFLCGGLLPVATMLIFACCSREIAPAVQASQEDGRLVFTTDINSANTKNALSRPGDCRILDTLDLGDGLTCVVKQEERELAKPTTKLEFGEVYSNENPFDSFLLTCFVWDESKDKYVYYDIDECDRREDRWISRKDTWRNLPQNSEHPPLFIARSHESCSSGQGWLYETEFCFFNDVAVYIEDVTDFCYGLSYFDGARAAQSISFRHMAAAVTVKTGMFPECTVTGVSFASSADGYMAWELGQMPPLFCEYSFYGYGIYPESRIPNRQVSFSESGEFLYGIENPFLIPPHQKGFEGTSDELGIRIERDGQTKEYYALLDLDFPSGTNTILEVSLNSEVLIYAPDVVCPWDEEHSCFGYTFIRTNIPDQSFADRIVSCAQKYVTVTEDATDKKMLKFTPKWCNVTDEDWTEDYSVSWGAFSGKGKVTVKAGADVVDLLGQDLPHFLFVGQSYNLSPQFESLYTGEICTAAPFLIKREYNDTYVSISDEGVVTPKKKTPSIQTLSLHINDDDYSVSSVNSSITHNYEVIEPLLSAYPTSLLFSAEESLKRAVTDISQELLDIEIDGRPFWRIPHEASWTFTLNAEPLNNIWFDWHNVSQVNVAFHGHLSDEIGKVKSFEESIPKTLDRFSYFYPVPPTGFAATTPISSIYLTTDNAAAVDVLSGTSKEITITSCHSWEITSYPAWVLCDKQSGGVTNPDQNTTSIFVAVSPNPTSQQRSGEIIIKTTDGSNLTQSIPITQAAGTGGGFNPGGFGGGSDSGEDF